MSADEGEVKAAGIVGPILHDALRPAAKEIGATLRGAVRVALSPIALATWTFNEAAEYARERVEQILDRRRVPSGAIKEPPPEIVGQAIHMLRFPNQNEYLRQLYLELLATAMDSRRSAHPAFGEVLRQLGPDEARVLPLLAGREGPPIFPMISLREYSVRGDYRLAQVRLRTLLGEASGLGHPLAAISVENLCRLGLAITNESTIAAGEWNVGEYDRLRAMKDVVEIAGPPPSPHSVPSGDRPRIEVHYESLRITEFGAQLALACTAATPDVTHATLTSAEQTDIQAFTPVVPSA